MKPGLSVGLQAELRWRVGQEHLIRLGAGQIGVFATPWMIYLMELAARQALGPYLEATEESVGVKVEAEHLAATPAGEEVRAVARVVKVDERLIHFQIEAFDEHERIGTCNHVRAVIGLEKFARKLSGKKKVSAHAEAAMPPSSSSIKVELKDKIAFVTLAREAKLNVIDPDMTETLLGLADWMEAHPAECRVMILTGAGKAFCAGNDLKQIESMNADARSAWNQRQIQLMEKLATLPQPLIAAVNGFALGGGFVLASACDIRIASRNAEFGLPEVTNGWPPSFGLPQVLALVPAAACWRLVLTGETLSAAQALELGIISEVHAPNLLLAAAEKLARKLLAKPAVGLRETRKLLRATHLSQQGSVERLTHDAYLRSLGSPDAAESLAAFREKRAPKFKAN